MLVGKTATWREDGVNGRNDAISEIRKTGESGFFPQNGKGFSQQLEIGGMQGVFLCATVGCRLSPNKAVQKSIG
jgi:hypothetical protein